LLPAYAGLLLGFFFDPEGEHDMFLRNVGWVLADCAEEFPLRLKRAFFWSANENVSCPCVN
jgi:hypothetical protein